MYSRKSKLTQVITMGTYMFVNVFKNFYKFSVTMPPSKKNCPNDLQETEIFFFFGDCN